MTAGPVSEQSAGQPPGLDAPRVTAWLRDAVGLDAPVRLARTGQGQSNLTFLVEDASGRRVVLRRPPLGQLARGAHDMHREHRILAALAAQPVPTPRPLAISVDGAVAGATVYAMEYIEGIVLHTNEVAERLAPAARGHAAASAVRSLTALHEVDVDDAGLAQLARRDGYGERQLRAWSRQWDATKTRELPVIERTARELSAAVPPQREVCIVHGDYNLANLIVGGGGEVRAILDWELCTLGDPVADLGTLLCYWPDRLEEAVLERDPVPLLEGFPRRAELVELYSRSAPERDLAAVGFWHALATWKLAVILEGVARRRIENPANSRSSVEQLRRATDRLAHEAARLTRSASR
jgi:aminoglycoside phosphotransferase (APT) family kinase protein